LKLTYPFKDHFTVDPEVNNQPRQVDGYLYSSVQPTQFNDPTLVHVSSEAASLLELDEAFIKSVTFKKIVTGQSASTNENAYAMNYGGHQFGHWAGQLGDGRAINLGAVNTATGTYQLQLKGAGPTPYSRRGDGYAVLRSSIREHLCSEAMHHLGIATTRSLSLSISGEKVLRDMFYDGNAAYEPGAIVCRVSHSFVRFGHFELLATRRDTDNLKKLCDFIIDQHYPETNSQGDSKYIEYFQQITNRTLAMVIDWQRVGFVHGVMNTDNMSILGLTIDYGPYGWLENYDPNWTPNTTDNQHKRYRYGTQPEIALWNLWQLANALALLTTGTSELEAILNGYKKDFVTQHHQMMASKLGLQKELPTDTDLIGALIHQLQVVEIDMTIFYRQLIQVSNKITVENAWSLIAPAFYDLENMQEDALSSWNAWLADYIKRLDSEKTPNSERKKMMRGVNPKYVLRNYMTQLAINAATDGDYSVIEELHKMLKQPYHEQPEFEKWYARRPDWARDKPGCSQLSCSS
jgi:uncharacterized protein YdiU (UPF0061 family)